MGAQKDPDQGTESCENRLGTKGAANANKNEGKGVQKYWKKKNAAGQIQETRKAL